MILTTGFVNGFQEKVSQKVFSFWGHIRVQQYEPDKSLVAEEAPFRENDSVLHFISQQPGVAQVQRFATKSAVLQRRQEIEGVLIKGIGPDYDSSALKPYLQMGRWPSFNDSLYSRDMLISATLARLLQVTPGDTLLVYFISGDNGAKTYRKLRVCGIYKTGIEEYDKLFVLADIRLIQRMNDWPENQIGGYEIFLDDYRKMDTVTTQLNNTLPPQWMSRSVREVYPNIFDWLNIQDVNRNVLFTVMAIVAIINLVTCLLILILERTVMIGVLKSVGASNGMIQRIFLYHAGLITLMGIGIGLVAGVGIGLLQQFTGFIRLDESSYYVSAAPVHLIAWQVAAICLGTAVICSLSLVIPTWLIRKVQPVQAIRFR